MREGLSYSITLLILSYRRKNYRKKRSHSFDSPVYLVSELHFYQILIFMVLMICEEINLRKINDISTD